MGGAYLFSPLFEHMRLMYLGSSISSLDTFCISIGTNRDTYTARVALVALVAREGQGRLPLFH